MAILYTPDTLCCLISCTAFLMHWITRHLLLCDFMYCLSHALDHQTHSAVWFHVLLVLCTLLPDTFCCVSSCAACLVRWITRHILLCEFMCCLSGALDYQTQSAVYFHVLLVWCAGLPDTSCCVVSCAACPTQNDSAVAGQAEQVNTQQVCLFICWVGMHHNDAIK